jgi:SAM-dependent methyltransferase
MYKSIAENLNGLIDGKILGISGIDNFYSLIDTNNYEIIHAEYPSIDMQHLPYHDNVFDFVISDQVIEHLEDPQKAVKESFRVLKTGGIAVHTSCFMNYIHPDPIDFWRFSPDALRHLCRDFSEVICCDGWGNRIAILLCFFGRRFRFAKIHDSKYSLLRLIANYNEPRYPIVTWIAVRK